MWNRRKKATEPELPWDEPERIRTLQQYAVAPRSRGSEWEWSPEPWAGLSDLLAALCLHNRVYWPDPDGPFTEVMLRYAPDRIRVEVVLWGVVIGLAPRDETERLHDVLKYLDTRMCFPARMWRSSSGWLGITVSA